MVLDSRLRGNDESLALYFLALDPASQPWTELQDLPSKISHVNLLSGDSGFWFASGMKGKLTWAEKDPIIT
jgi:hypothetical protein